MPIQSVQRLYAGDPLVEVGLRLYGVGKDGLLEVLYQDIPGNSWNPQRIAKFTERAQQLIDVRIPLDDPSLVDDPAGPNGADPARPDFFWDSGDLVARSIIISDVSFTEPDGPLNFTITRARQ